MEREEGGKYSALILRIVLGLLFIIPGIAKLMDIAGTAGFFGSLGIPAATAAAWVVGLVELLFGIAVLIGWQVKWTVWPLVAVLLVAIALVHVPNTSMMTATTLIFHVLGIAALVSVFLTGAGAYAVDRE